MSRYVVDASVAIKWFLPEVHSEAANRLLSGSHTLLVPDLLFSEVGTILWKRIRKEELAEEEAAAILRTLGALRLEVSPTWTLTTPALEIACRTQRTVYDSLYLALAFREQSRMVTADEKFFNALKSSPLTSYLCWVEDIL